MGSRPPWDIARWLRRPLELLLGTGIPLLGYFSVARGEIPLGPLSGFLAALLLAGWHILTVNDLLFERQPFAPEKLWQTKNLIPVWLAPAVAVGLLLPLGNSAPGLALIIFNWDLYAWRGKRSWQSALFHHLLGGGLHFLLGATAAGLDAIAPVLPQTLFFALAMAGASCHHDANHAAEDLAQGYATGAVRFGRDRWWRLGLVPMLGAQAALWFATCELRNPFLAAFVVYFSLYLSVTFRDTPGAIPWFRPLCRLAYAAAGLWILFVRLLD